MFKAALDEAALRSAGSDRSAVNPYNDLPLVVFGSFGVRLAAYMVDSVVLFVLSVPVLAIAMGLAFFFVDFETVSSDDLVVIEVAMRIVSASTALFYFAGFHASRWQATPGKKLLGLVVTDERGRRISLLHGIGRYFAMIPAGCLFGFGFLAVLWNRRRQGWHDAMAGTFVLRRSGLAQVGIDIAETGLTRRLARPAPCADNVWAGPSLSL